MKDVATYAGRKLLLWAIPQTIFAVFSAAATVILGTMYFFGQIREGLAEWYYPIILLLPRLLSHYIFSGGIRLWRSALEKDFCLRADTQGIAWRLPGKPQWNRMGMTGHKLTLASAVFDGTASTTWSIQYPDGRAVALHAGDNTSAYIQATDGQQKYRHEYVLVESAEIIPGKRMLDAP